MPVAGNKNPFQYLMIKGLNEAQRIKAISGIDNRFFGIYLTAIRQRPTYIHFDWLHSYYYRRTLWMSILNLPLFTSHVLIIKYLLGDKRSHFNAGGILRRYNSPAFMGW